MDETETSEIGVSKCVQVNALRFYQGKVTWGAWEVACVYCSQV